MQLLQRRPRRPSAWRFLGPGQHFELPFFQYWYRIRPGIAQILHLKNEVRGKSMRYSGIYAVIFLSITLIVAAIVSIIENHTVRICGDLAISLFFSILIPVAFLIARNKVRSSRIHAAEVFRHTFEGSLSSNTYFEFIERKYYSGIAAPGTAASAVRPHPAIGISGWLLLGASLPFIMFTAAGVFFLLLPSHEQVGIVADSLGGSTSSPVGATITPSKYCENSIAIGSLAFAGAYLYSVRLFFKSLVAHSPFAIALLRAFAHMLFAVMLAVMIWRVVPDAEPLTKVAAKVQNSIVSGNKVTARPSQEEAREPGLATEGQISKLWLMLALAIGFVPDYAFSWLLQRAHLTFNRRYSGMAKHSALIPLTVIDGIDFAKAFRMEEGNIVSVQNLAAANPVMLHVETPYCIFLIMDWIAQAQLCAATGPERFFLFRKINIRTIFDLERAVLDPSSPVGLKQIVGAILLANDGAKTSLSRDFGVRPLDMAHRDFDKALASWVNVEVIEHIVRVIMDSLHIHHFRQLWRDIEESLPPANAGTPQRASPKILPATAAVAAPAQSNGGGRDPHSVEIAAV